MKKVIILWHKISIKLWLFMQCIERHKRDSTQRYTSVHTIIEEEHYFVEKIR